MGTLQFLGLIFLMLVSFSLQHFANYLFRLMKKEEAPPLFFFVFLSEVISFLVLLWAFGLYKEIFIHIS